MCLILFARAAGADAPLLVAANRDEFFDRPAAPAAFWEQPQGLLAGRDLSAGGTWLGVTTSGRFAAITNYRDPSARKTVAPSRGALVVDFLAGDKGAEPYLRSVALRADQFNGFSMIAGDRMGLYFFSNREDAVKPVEPGVHGLSNHLLDTPWPKVEKGKAALAVMLDREFEPEACFRLLADNSTAEDDVLPQTGFGPVRERQLAAIHVQAGDYGTRCSTLVRIGAGCVEFHERSFGRDGLVSGTVNHRFRILPDSTTSQRVESRPPGIPRPAP